MNYLFFARSAPYFSSTLHLINVQAYDSLLLPFITNDSCTSNRSLIHLLQPSASCSFNPCANDALDLNRSIREVNYNTAPARIVNCRSLHLSPLHNFAMQNPLFLCPLLFLFPPPMPCPLISSSSPLLNHDPQKRSGQPYSARGEESWWLVETWTELLRLE